MVVMLWTVLVVALWERMCVSALVVFLLAPFNRIFCFSIQLCPRIMFVCSCYYLFVAFYFELGEGLLFNVWEVIIVIEWCLFSMLQFCCINNSF